MINPADIKPVRLATVFILTLFLAACGNNGVRLSDAAISGNPSAMWEEGQRAVTAGEGLVERGEKRLAEGRAQVREGEIRISEGNTRVLQAKQDYIAAAANTSEASTPKQVEEGSQRLRAIGKRWEDAIAEIRAGNNLVDRGKKNIDKGQAEIREGRMLMEQGSTLMRNSQRVRRGEPLLPERGSRKQNEQKQAYGDDYAVDVVQENSLRKHEQTGVWKA